MIKRLSYIISVLIAVIVLNGCSLHNSKISGPIIDMPLKYSLRINGDSAPLTGKWWEQFKDESLNALIEEALKNNLDIRQAVERYAQAGATVKISSSSRWPAINIKGSGGRARQPTSLVTVTDNTFSLSAAAVFEIDLWQKLKSRTDAAIYDLTASEQDLKALYISITAQLADLYYLAAEQKAQLELSDRTIASFEDTLERVEFRYRGGLVPAIDVYQSRQNLASARAQRPLFESNLKTTLNAITVLTGRMPGTGEPIAMTGLREVYLSGPGVPSQLLENRPDIEAALLRLYASDERIAAAVADRFPSFNLVGTYGGSSNELHSILDSPNIFWNILLQIAQPVFDTGRRKAEVRKAESVFREKLAGYHKTVLNAFREVEDALVKIRASEERIRMLQDTVSASDSSLRLALERYMQGLTDYLLVLTEQLRNFSAKSNLLVAKRQLISDRIQLARALGGEWVDAIRNKYLITEKMEKQIND